MRDLIERLEKATGPDRELDEAIWLAAIPGATRKNLMEEFPAEKPLWEYYDPEQRAYFRAGLIPAYTASTDAAVALVERCLPGWMWRVASCSVSDDAWVAPDYSCPKHGERLIRELGDTSGDPTSHWIDITDVDLRPPGRPAIALCLALLRALDAQVKT